MGTEFKKYKNRKIYNTSTSKYATLSDVYYTALQGPVTVTDVTTGSDITNETLVRGALEIFNPENLLSLAAAAIEVGIKAGITAPLISDKQAAEAFALAETLANASHQEIDDLFSGKEAT